VALLGRGSDPGAIVYAEAARLPLIPELAHGVSFMLWALFLNLIMLLFIWTGPVYLVLYYVVNSHLLGREFFEIVAGRHLKRSGAKTLRKDYKFETFIAGLVILGATLFPVTTLFTPFIALALMVHLYWQIIEKEGAAMAENDTDYDDEE
jgi:CysZ protein